MKISIEGTEYEVAPDLLHALERWIAERGSALARQKLPSGLLNNGAVKSFLNTMIGTMIGDMLKGMREEGIAVPPDTTRDPKTYFSQLLARLIVHAIDRPWALSTHEHTITGLTAAPDQPAETPGD